MHYKAKGLSKVLPKKRISLLFQLDAKTFSFSLTYLIAKTK